jgi:hypothetical protein
VALERFLPMSVGGVEGNHFRGSLACYALFPDNKLLRVVHFFYELAVVRAGGVLRLNGDPG